MKHQEDNTHSKIDHGDSHHPTEHHQAGHHHAFNGIEAWIARLSNPEREKKQRPNEVITKLGLQNHDIIADIGAGTGYFALRIAEAYPQVKVIAADSEPEMIGYLQTQSIERKLTNLEPILIDPAKPQLPSRANLALIVDTLHHIHNRVEYLNTLKENMAPGSRIAIIDYSIEAVEGPPADHRLPMAKVVEELNQVGYSLEHDFKLLPNQYFLIFKQQ